MLKVIFYIKAEKYLNGENPIFSKISYNNKSITLSTGKSISKERWQSTNKLRKVLKIEKEKVLKQSLDLYQLRIEKKFLELYKTDLNVSLIDLKKQIKGKPKLNIKSAGILEIFDKHNLSFKKRVAIGERAPASLQKYNRSKDLVKEFIKNKYNLNDYPVNEINGAFIYNLESFLKYDSKYKYKKGIKNNSVVKYFKNFKTVCNYGIKLELINKNPFDIYDGKITVKDAIYLNQQELDLIENKIFNTERLEKVKDIFLFSCYTGYAPIDACNLTERNLYKDNDGNLWIKTHRTKTSIKANVPVLPPTLRIIEKYRDKQIGLIPKLSNQKMNSYLKEIADVCGIKKNLTWYVARHTFATTITLANGVRIENVSSMLGHTNIKQTQHYAKVLDESVMNDMIKLKNKFL